MQHVISNVLISRLCLCHRIIIRLPLSYLLWWHVQSDGTQVNPLVAFDAGQDEKDAWNRNGVVQAAATAASAGKQQSIEAGRGLNMWQ